MKAIISAASIALFLTACTSNPKTVVTTTTTPLVDSTEMAAYQEFKQQKVRDSIEAVVRAEQATAAAAARSTKTTRNTSTTRSYSNSATGSNTGTTTMNSESSNAAERRGMSKTAKGAIIGGVVGAGTGAVVNKKNRGAGAVVGGVVGAGAGAVIGRQKDKKDGRN